MIIDRINALEALGQRGVHTVRCRYADSAEDAVAFAARRIARDERLLAVRLYGAFAGVAIGSTPAFTEEPFTDRASIAAAYERLAPRVAAAGGRVVVQDAVPGGSDIAIEGSVDPALGKFISVRSALHRVQRMVPLDLAAAEVLAGNFAAHQHHGSRNHERRMLEHLLLRLSAFFQEDEIGGFELDPVRLHENNYTVMDAIVVGPHPLRVETHERHDRKGHYQASGRQ